jgi:hypothetical protein
MRCGGQSGEIKCILTSFIAACTLSERMQKNEGERRGEGGREEEKKSGKEEGSKRKKGREGKGGNGRERKGGGGTRRNICFLASTLSWTVKRGLGFRV